MKCGENRKNVRYPVKIQGTHCIMYQLKTQNGGLTNTNFKGITITKSG